MPDDRLAELLRQRALLSQHVAWLDAEIARASGAPAPGSAGFPPAPKPEPLGAAPHLSLAPTPPATPATATSVVAATATPATAAEPLAEPVNEAVMLANQRADEIIANYSATDKFDPESTRRGCLLLAIGVFLIGTAILIGIYLLNYR